MAHVKNNSQIIFHKLVWGTQEDPDQIPLVRYDTDTIILLTDIQAQIIKALQKNTIQQAAQKLEIKEKDIHSFVEFLIDNNFIKQIDDTLIPDNLEKIQPTFMHIPANFFSFSLSKICIASGLFVIIFGITLSFLNPQLAPRLSHFYWTSDNFTLYASFLIVSYFGILIHEGAHYATTRAINKPARINIFNNRFFDLISETISYHLITAPLPNRLWVYISGIYVDLLQISICYILLSFPEQLAINPTINAFLLFIVFNKIIGIIWQFSIHLETDIYNVLSEYLKEANLYNDTKKYVGLLLIHKLPFAKNLIRKILITEDVKQNADDLRLLTNKDKLKISIYSTLFFTGLMTSAILFFIVVLPRDAILAIQSLQAALVTIQNNQPVEATKNMLVVLMVSYSYLVLLYLFIKKINQKKSII